MGRIKTVSEMCKKLNKQMCMVLAFGIMLMIVGQILVSADTTDLSIEEVHNLTLKTNTYTFDSAGASYSQTLTATTTLTVYGQNKNTDDTAHAQYDLVVVPSVKGGSLENVSVTNGTGFTADTSVENALVYRDNSLSFGSSENVTVSNEDGKSIVVYVFRAYTDDYVDETDYHHNAYVTDFFDLQMLQDVKAHNSDEKNTADRTSYADGVYNYKSVRSYRNIFILNDITANEELTLNIPCNINLLNSTLKLDKPLTIKHNYAGLYNIENLSSGVVDNSACNFTVNTPRAYYVTESNKAYNTADKFVKKTADDKTTEAWKTAYKSALMSDAVDYLDNFIPKYIFDDVMLPQNYHGYGISYTYNVVSNVAFNNKGKTTRQTDNTAVQIGYTVSYDGTDVTGTLNRTVAGTSQAALSVVLSGELEDLVDKSSDTVESEKYLTRAVDVKLLFNQFLADTAEQKYSYKVDFSASGLYFDVNGADNASLSKKMTTLFVDYDSTNSKYTVNIKNDDSSIVDYSDVETIILRHSDYMPEGTTVAVNTYADLTNKKTFSVKLGGSSIEARNKLLNRYRDALGYNAKGDSCNVLALGTDGIYSGTDMKIDSTMNITNMTYAMYYVDSADLEGDVSIPTLEAGSTSLDSVDLLGGSTAYFTINSDNALVLNNAISLESGKALALVSTVTYADDGGTVSKSYQQVIIPSQGIGGTGTSYNISSGQFKPIFDKSDGLSFPTAFESPISEVSLEMSVTSITTGGVEQTLPQDYCTVRSTDSGKKWWIDIDISKVPSTDTTVTVEADFYIYINDEKSYISKQPYSFVIPGIYRYGSTQEVKDVWVYLDMLNTYGEYNGYLLKKNAESSLKNSTFDCSSAKLDKIKNKDSTVTYNIDNLVTDGVITEDQKTTLEANYSSAHDVDGIQYLVNTDIMSFDGVNIASLEPFEKTNAENASLSVNDLSMKGCQLSSDDISSAGHNLTKLINLKTVNLDNNNITSLEDILYRTVTSLSVNGQGSSLSDISGISSLPNIKTVELKDNTIKDFRPLCELSKLKSAKVSGNTVSGTHYGTHGDINLCTYVLLCHNGVDVYTTAANKAVILEKTDTVTAPILSADGYEIDYKQEYLSIGINSIMYMSEYASSQCTSNFPTEMTSGSGDKLYEYTFGDGTQIAYTITHETPVSQGSGKYTAVISITGADKASQAVSGDYWYGDSTVVYREITYTIS